MWEANRPPSNDHPDRIMNYLTDNNGDNWAMFGVSVDGKELVIPYVYSMRNGSFVYCSNDYDARGIPRCKTTNMLNLTALYMEEPQFSKPYHLFRHVKIYLSITDEEIVIRNVTEALLQRADQCNIDASSIIFNITQALQKTTEKCENTSSALINRTILIILIIHCLLMCFPLQPQAVFQYLSSKRNTRKTKVFNT